MSKYFLLIKSIVIYSYPLLNQSRHSLISMNIIRKIIMKFLKCLMLLITKIDVFFSINLLAYSLPNVTDVYLPKKPLHN